METSFFGFDGEEQGQAALKKIESGSPKSELFGLLSFLVTAIRKKFDSGQEWMKYVYPFQMEGMYYYGTTDGNRLHYVPASRLRGYEKKPEAPKTVYEVKTFSKGSIALVEAPVSPWMEEKSSVIPKVIPSLENCVELPPNKVWEENPYTLEWIYGLVQKLSGGVICLRINHLTDFVNHLALGGVRFYSFSGIVKVFAPKARPSKAWRFEFWDEGSLIFGAVLAPPVVFKRIVNFKCLYNEATLNNEAGVSEPAKAKDEEPISASNDKPETGDELSDEPF